MKNNNKYYAHLDYVQWRGTSVAKTDFKMSSAFKYRLTLVGIVIEL
ncbi:MAG TPA: hypothetical protein VE692_05160 [Nitrososphaera sp.]|nr:hypothetical protein [Nitrososphaera sp.]